MTDFITREQSNYDGEPIALYEFRRGAISRCYASCAEDITASGKLYAGTPISDAGINQKGTAVTDVFEMTVPADIEVAQWYISTAPSDTVYVIVRRFHYGDSEAVIMWLGQIVAVEFNADDSAKISAQAVSISLKRGGLRLTWQRGCGHALYDQNCTINKDAHKRVVTITAVDNVSITVSEEARLDDGYWQGGIISWEIVPGVIEKRLIEQIQSVDSRRLYPYGFTDGFSVGQTVTIYPGCKRTGQWCDNYFANIENYGGFMWMPNRSPYDGDTVF